MIPEEIPEKVKYFSENQINISVVLGGPIPAGIMFYKNFKLLNRDRDAWFSILVTVIFSILLIFLLIKLPDNIINRVPGFVFTAFYAIISATLYHFFLKKHIKKLTDENSVRASNWTVAGYTLLGLVLFMLVTFLIVITEPPFKGESVKVGETNNEIYYQRASISENDIQALADNLYDLGYFSEETNNAVLLTRNKEGYTVTIPTNKSVWDDLSIEYSVVILKKELIFNYSSPVTIVLEDYDAMGNRITKEF